MSEAIFDCSSSFNYFNPSEVRYDRPPSVKNPSVFSEDLLESNKDKTLAKIGSDFNLEELIYLNFNMVNTAQDEELLEGGDN